MCFKKLKQKKNICRNKKRPNKSINKRPSKTNQLTKDHLCETLPLSFPRLKWKLCLLKFTVVQELHRLQALVSFTKPAVISSFKGAGSGTQTSIHTHGGNLPPLLYRVDLATCVCRTRNRVQMSISNAAIKRGTKKRHAGIFYFFLMM